MKRITCDEAGGNSNMKPLLDLELWQKPKLKEVVMTYKWEDSYDIYKANGSTITNLE